jgi:hypothetical protein
MRQCALLLRMGLTGLFGILADSAFAQSPYNAPEIQWQLSFGGTDTDSLQALQQTSDGGYIFRGYSNSTNGNKTAPNFGGVDFWVIRIDAATNKVWERTFGGTENDVLKALQQTSDGGYILGGYSASGAGGNKTTTNYGGLDYWVVRLDALGEKLWEGNFGGSGADELHCLQQTSDGGFILGGSSGSYTNETKTSLNWGSADYWVVRLDSEGNKLWDQTCGGPDRDFLRSVKQTPDGGFVLGGYSGSYAGGTKTAQNIGGMLNLWLVRLDANGNQLWDKAYFITTPETLYPSGQDMWVVENTSDGGFLLGGSAYYFVPTQFYKYYAAIVRVDGEGTELWQRTHDSDGGVTLRSRGEHLDSLRVLPSQTGSIFGGTSRDFDFWFVRLDENGNRYWQALYGGAGSDDLRCAQQTIDGGFILGGRSASGIGGNKTVPNYGSDDYWIIKLGPEAPRLQARLEEDGFHLNLLPGETNHLYRIERSADLLNWTAFHTNQPSAYRVEIVDPFPAVQTRFYRAGRLP